MKKTLVSSTIATFLAIGSANSAVLFNQISAPNRNDFSGTVGVQFTVGSSDLSVTHLGFQDEGSDGLQSAHQVGIWDNSGTLISSTTIQAGTASQLSDNWRYEALGSSVILSAGNTYTIGASVFNAGDLWSDQGASPSISGSSDIVIDNEVFTGSSFARPTTDGGGSNSRWSPANATFTAVPEPSSFTLLGLGGLALLRRRRK